MTLVPKKNISRSIRDIFRTADRETAEIQAGESDPELEEDEPEILGSYRPSPPVGRYVMAFAGITMIAALIFGYLVYRSGSSRLEKVSGEMERLQSVMPDIRSMDFGSAADKLRASQEGLRSIFQMPPTDGKMGLDNLVQILGGLFAGAGTSYNDLQKTIQNSIQILSEMEEMQKHWPDYLFRGQGQELIEHLRKIRDSLSSFEGASGSIISRISGIYGFRGVDPSAYLDMRVQVSRGREFLDALIPWLGGERRLAILFYNPSELRPGGGFLGSYAELVLKNGSVTDLKVRDINEPDRLFSANIIPPKQLQGLVRRWRAADANWFFDFPSSAEKTLSFLEASGMYASTSHKFDGAVALTPQVVADILARTGPVKLDSGQTIDADNFLPEVQKDVQAGQEKGSKDPKAILSMILPRIIERAVAGSSTSPVGLNMLEKWAEHKDVMAYFREASFENFADALGASGKVFALPENSNVDYLAVVNANIGGAKTDIYMDRTITFSSQIGADGVASNEVTVEQHHGGDKAKDWWYKEPNEDYMQIFAPYGAKLLDASGTLAKNITPKADYAKEKFQIDPDLAAMESTFTESPIVPRVVLSQQAGKSVFGTWTRTLKGATSTASFNYRYRLFTPPKAGEKYSFVLERQAGAGGKYKAEIFAPPGFVFRETGLATFDYSTDDLPGRISFELTFEEVK